MNNQVIINSIEIDYFVFCKKKVDSCYIKSSNKTYQLALYKQKNNSC